jgi:hypothetical protein
MLQIEFFSARTTREGEVELLRSATLRIFFGTGHEKGTWKGNFVNVLLTISRFAGRNEENPALKNATCPLPNQQL